MKLKNRTCLIIGASGAIGSVVAEMFAAEGARLALTCRSGTSGFPAQLLDRKECVSTHVLDVCSSEQVKAVISSVEEGFGPIQVLVNCSGILGPVGPTDMIPEEEWIQTIEINLIGSFRLVRAVLPSMRRAGGGKIIHFSGGGAAYGRAFFTAYSASKAALVRFTESLAMELSDQSIQLNAIAPGPVKSRMWDELARVGAAGGTQALEELRKMAETGGVPAERAAALAVFLASNDSKNLTGRLISAVYDPWEEVIPNISRIMTTEQGTLRRMPFDFKR